MVVVVAFLHFIPRGSLFLYFKSHILLFPSPTPFWFPLALLFFFKYILLITVFPIFPPLPPYTAQPSSILPNLVHLHRLYIYILWILCFLHHSNLSPSILCLPIMLLIPCTFSPYSSPPLLHRKPSMWCPFLWLCSCSSCLLSFWFHCFSFF